LEDSAALTGLVFAAIGVALSAWLGYLAADAIASIAIGCLLIMTAVILGNETRSLIAGESASPRVLEAVRTLLASDSRVRRVEGIMSLHLGPSEVLIAVTLEFRAGLSVDEVRATAQELRDRLEAGQPIISHVFFRLAPSEQHQPHVEDSKIPLT
jgi:divalent metal cation (Fe/Co/Zn/Cd) transporter